MKACGALLLLLFCVGEAHDTVETGGPFQLKLEKPGLDLEVVIGHQDPNPGTGNSMDGAKHILQSILDQLQNLTELTDHLDKLETRLNTMTDQRDQCQTRFDNMTDQRDQWKTRLDTMTDQRDQWETRLDTMTEQRDQCQTSLTTMTDQRDQLQTSYDELLSRHDNLKRKCCESRGFTFGGDGCYYISTERKTWEDSRAFCTARQSDLMTIKSQEKQDFVKGLVDRNNWTWFGLTDRETEGVWKWVDGTPLTTPTYWNPGQPDDHGPGEGDDCAIFYNGGWGDYPCGRTLYWMCEIVF